MSRSRVLPQTRHADHLFSPYRDTLASVGLALSHTVRNAMEELSLPTPDTFSAFPFLPYEIQLELMRHLYENIEGRKVTIVESPTGTVSTD